MPERDDSVAPEDAALAGDTESLGARTSPGTTTDAAFQADEVLVAARGLARTALLEVTPERTIGPDAGHTVEDEHVLSLRFSSRVDGYVGWFWTVTIARVDDEAPTVLEISMMPGDGALTAPEWVPWSDRLADYRESQDGAGSVDATDGDGLDDEGPDDDVDEADVDEADIDEADIDEDDGLDIDDADVDDSDVDDSDDDHSDDDDGEFDDDDDDDDEDGDDDEDSDEEEQGR
jgi:hypothetical protein